MTVRLVYIVDTLDQSGAAQQVALLARHLDPAEFEIHCAVLDQRPEISSLEMPAHVEVKFFAHRWRTDPLTAIQLYRYLGKVRPKLVHCWGNWSANYVAAMGYTGVLTLRSAPESRFDPRSGRLAAWLQRKASLVLPCESLRSSIRQSNQPARRALAERCQIVLPGVELPGPHTKQVSRESLFAPLQIPADAWVAGAVGRLSSFSRHRELIWATDLLVAIRPNLHLVIVGDGPDRRWLERFSSQVRRGDRIHFVGRQFASRWIPHFDSLCIAHTTGGIPQSGLEAMSHGVAVIAADTGCHREMLALAHAGSQTRPEAGLLYPPGIAPELSKRMKWLIDEPARADQVATAGRALAAERFTPSAMATAYTELYRQRVQ